MFKRTKPITFLHLAELAAAATEMNFLKTAETHLWYGHIGANMQHISGLQMRKKISIQVNLKFRASTVQKNVAISANVTIPLNGYNTTVLYLQESFLRHIVLLYRLIWRFKRFDVVLGKSGSTRSADVVCSLYEPSIQLNPLPPPLPMSFQKSSLFYVARMHGRPRLRAHSALTVLEL